jgi:hypothetical protein
MALICPACGTENRSVAKFCIECIGALPTGFAPTQLAPRPLASDRLVPEGMPSALAAFASAGPVAAATPAAAVVRAAPAPTPEPRGRTGLWVSVGALAIALVIGAAGWAAAGAGGWYIYKANSGPEERGPAPVAATAVAEQVPAPAIVARATAPVEAVATAPAITPAPVPMPPRQDDKPQRVEEVLDAPVVARPEKIASLKPPAAPVHAHAGAAPAGLAKTCGGLNFFAAARCRASECAKPALRQSAECRPVLAQERLMEEKRNPSLLN